MKKYFLELNGSETMLFKKMLELFASVQDRELSLLESCMLIEKASKWLQKMVFIKNLNRFQLLASEVVLVRKLLLLYPADNEGDLANLRLFLMKVDKLYYRFKQNYNENTNKILPSAANYIKTLEGNSFNS